MISRLGDLPFNRISAIDGQSLNDLEFVSQINQQKMTKNEIACILSHRKVWQKIVDNKIPCACILEDDVNLSSSFPNFIRDISWLPDSFDVIKIETFLDRVSLSYKKTIARDRILRQLGSMHAGSAGYIVSLKGAIKLLNIAQHLDRPLDHLMFEVKTTRSEFRVMQLSPALCIQEEVLLPDVAPSSDITNDRRIRQSQKSHAHGRRHAGKNSQCHQNLRGRHPVANCRRKADRFALAHQGVSRAGIPRTAARGRTHLGRQPAHGAPRLHRAGSGRAGGDSGHARHEGEELAGEGGAGGP